MFTDFLNFFLSFLIFVFLDIDQPQHQTPSKCDNTQCNLEDYLNNLAQAPEINHLRHTPVNEFIDSPGKENVPPLENRYISIETYAISTLRLKSFPEPL